MKKYFIIAAAALATLASCTEIEKEKPQEKISFKAVNFKNSTKAAINDATFPTSLGFKVSAVYTGTAEWASASTKTSYFNGSTCAYNDTEDLWVSTPEAYWPLSGFLTFAAVTPDGNWADDLSKLTVNNFSVGSYAVPTTNPTEGQKDLMYTLPQDACNVQNSDMVAGNNKADDYGTTNAKYGVSLKFRHALSQVVVYAKAKDGQTGVSFEITELTLNVKDGATIEVTPSNFNATTHAEVATPTSFTSNLTCNNFLQTGITLSSAQSNGTYTSVTKQYNSKDLGVLVIPQALGDDQTLKVKYTMKFNDVPAGEKEVTIKLNSGHDGALTAFAPNKIYKLELELSAETIKYAPKIINWDDSTAESQYDVK